MFNEWYMSVYCMLYIVLFVSILCIAIYKNINKEEKFEFLIRERGKDIEVKTTLYTFLIFVCVFSYAALLPITDIIWKKNLSILCEEDPIKYSSFIATVTKYTGISIIFFIMVFKPLVLKLRWKHLALVTPISYLLLFSPVFMVIFLDSLTFLNIHTNVYYIISYVGAFQVSIFHSLKYTVFDTVKEMAILKINKRNQAQAKSFIDIIGFRFGNAFGGWLVIILFSIFHTLELREIYPYLFLAILLISMLWVFSTVLLAKIYKK